MAKVIPILIRLEPADLKRLEAIASGVAAASAGRPSRSAAIRWLLREVLVEEGDGGAERVARPASAPR